MKAKCYDVLDTLTNKIIIKQKTVREIAEELGLDKEKVNRVVCNAKGGMGQGFINKRYKVICDVKYDFTFIDEDGIRKTFSKEWDKVLKNLSKVEKGILKKIPITGRD